MSSIRKIGAILAATMSAVGCAYLPQVNAERRVEVSDIKAVVECEVVAAVRALGPSIFTLGKWDVKSTLDLTLVEDITADGKIVWTIPVANPLTPSANVEHKKTSTAHVEFITIIREAMKGRAGACVPQLDPSETSLGLAAWIEATFLAIGKDHHGGLSYTVIFEVTMGAGTRFGFAFTRVPVTGDVGAVATRTGTNQLVVSVSPHIDPPPEKPMEVVIVGDKRDGTTVKSAPTRNYSRREQILMNPLGNQMLRQQAPVRLLPGTTLPVR